jgi:hypothetical protein
MLPDLILSGSLCSLDMIFGEFHPAFAPLNFPGHRVPLQSTKQAKNFEDALLTAISASRNCKTRFIVGDDEAYLHDGMPLPSPPNDDSKSSDQTTLLLRPKIETP